MCREVSEYGMPYCVSTLQTDILPQNASRRVVDPHLRRVVGGGVDQDRHVQSGEAQRVGDAAFVAEVGERDDHAVDVVPMLPEEGGAGLGLVATLDGAVVRLARPHDHGVVPLLLQGAEDLLASRAGEVSRKEAPIADDDAELHLAGRPAPRGGLRRRCPGGRGALRRELAAHVRLNLVESHLAPLECAFL